MDTRGNHITSTAATLTGLALLCMLASGVNAALFSWDGNGDVDNGGNWSDPLNWDLDSGYPDGTNDTTSLPAPGVARYITNDVAVTIDTLTMQDGSNNRLVLGADMKVRFVDGWTGGDSPKLNLNGYTFTVTKGNSLYLPAMDGAGRLVKIGADQATLQNADTFTGSIMVSNGYLWIRSGAWNTASQLTVVDGAAAMRDGQIGSDGATLWPQAIEINGNGYGARGALSIGYVDTRTVAPVTVASDARITVEAAGKTFTLSGDIDGPGVLTLEPKPGRTIDINGSSITYSNRLIVTNGTVVISGDLPNIENILVDAGGVLEGLQVQFPNASVVTQNGGIWNQALNATWTGSGDGSNWTDTANWSPQIVPTNTATISAPGSPRVIVVDTNLTLTTLILTASGNNNLRLAANLTVNRVETGYQSSLHMNGYTFTLNESIASYIFGLTGGGGLFVKTGSSTCYAPGSSTGYTGDYAVNGGMLYMWGGALGSSGSTNMTIADGATVQLSNPPEASAFPSNVVINGDGGTGDGAIRNAYTAFNFYPDLTVATDALMYNARAGVAFTIHGDVTGPGNLTLGGTATSTCGMNGVYNFVISGAAGNKIIADSGTVNISNATLSVSGEETATKKEYVVIDYSGAGTLAGEFAAINDLKPGGSIDYDGTDLNPDCVVLLAPSTGLILLIQ